MAYDLQYHFYIILTGPVSVLCTKMCRLDNPAAVAIGPVCPIMTFNMTISSFRLRFVAIYFFMKLLYL